MREAHRSIGAPRGKAPQMPFRRGSRSAQRVAKRLSDAARLRRMSDEQRQALEAQAAAGPTLPLLELGEGGGKGRGRPKGARSWDHVLFAKYMEARGYVDPRVMWAETISRPAAMLAAELGCTPERAFELQLRASQLLDEHVGQKLPKAVQVDARGDFQLVIEGAATAAAPAIAAGEGLVIDAQPLPIADDGKSST